MDESPEDTLPAGLRSRRRAVVVILLVIAATFAVLSLLIVPLALTPATPPPTGGTGGAAPAAAKPEPKALDVSYVTPFGLGSGIRRVTRQTVALQCPVEGDPDASTYGTGFLIAYDVVISAAHITSARKSGVEVRTYCGGAEPVIGTVVALDELRDVMVVRTKGCPAENVAFDVSRLRVNDPLHVAGFNFSGMTGSASRYYSMTSPIPSGSFTAKDAIGDPDVSQRVLDMEKAGVPRFRAIAGAAVPGNSGSPVFTDEGKVVGMLVLRDPRHNRSFFVPAVTIQRVLSDAGIK
jgi:S1-C subfamily serine protease